MCLEELWQTPFSRLTPTRMVDRGINVRIETVFLSGGAVPSGRRHVFYKLYFDERLYAFEAVLPRDYHPHRSAILVGQCFAVHSDAQQRQRIHRFIEPQTLDVREVKVGVFRQGHLLRVVVALEGDEARLWARLNDVCEHTK